MFADRVPAGLIFLQSSGKLKEIVLIFLARQRWSIVLAFESGKPKPLRSLRRRRARAPCRNLYGTTEFGGSNVCGNWGCGAMFKLAPPSGGGWTETILYNLGNSNQNPNSSMVQFHDGLLFGTTTYLGASDLGQVFTLVP